MTSTRACTRSKASYLRGCRCAVCRDGNAAAQAMARDQAFDRPVPEKYHGTHYGYAYYTCRCEACRDAKARHNREYRRRRRAKLDAAPPSE